MKKILLTGAAGIIGTNVIKYLLSEGKYEITLLDLKNKRSIDKLKKYEKRVNIVYGDINDVTLMEALIKSHDVVIHLAGTLPPLANIKHDLPRIIDYEGTKNIVEAIRMYNPNCLLIYASSTTLYGRIYDSEKLTTKNDVVIHENDWYSKYKYDAENYIKGHIKNYIIYRIPIVLGNTKNDLPMYNVPKNSIIEFIGAKDIAYVLVSTIDYKDKLNKKIYNLTGGEKCRTTFKNHFIKLLEIYGLSIRLIVSYFLTDKNFYSGYYTDTQELNNLLDYQNEELTNYYKRVYKYNKKRRLFQRLLAKPIICFIKKRNK